MTTTEQDVRVGQARLEEGLKHLDKTMTEGFKRLEQAMTTRDDGYNKLEARVSALENWRWYIIGAFAAVIFVAEWGVKLLK